MTFTRRKIDLQFQFGSQATGGEGDTVSVSGLRCSASITKAGGVSMTELNLRVWGLPLTLMNRLTILNQLLTQNRHNTITVSAGDEQSGMAVAFVGTIVEAWADMQSAPDTSFVVRANTGLLDAVKPVPATSYSGSVDAALVLAGIAAQMTPPRTIENSGVNVQIRDPYLPGTLRDQALAIQRAADCYMLIDDTADVIAIWPKDGVRGGEVPLISKDTGMVGYPTYTQSGISLTTLYNPSITFGGSIKVESILTPAAGFWTPNYVGHDLDAEVPGGKWYTHIEASLYGQTVAING